MSKKHYDEASVVRSLSKKNEIRIDTRKQVIEVAKNACNVGNGSWGKIDYLIKVHDYTQIFVKRVGERVFSSDNDGANNIVRSKRNKLNMATMTKDAMKRVKNKQS